MTKVEFGLAVMIALVSLPINEAYSQWLYRVTDEDVFGDSRVNAYVEGDSGITLTIQCNGNGDFDLAYLIPGTQSEIDAASKADGGEPSTLFIKVDQEKLLKFNAIFRKWNDHYLGVVASGRTKELVSAVRVIANARKSISVGVEVLGNREARNFVAAGSTAAMSAVIKKCNLEEIDSAAPPETDRSNATDQAPEDGKN